MSDSWIRSEDRIRQTLPSVDRLLRSPHAPALIARFGRPLVVEAIRHVLADTRAHYTIAGDTRAPNSGPEEPSGPTPSRDHSPGHESPGLEPLDPGTLMARVASALERRTTPQLRRVFNLTGTVIHTNLGRAPLPPSAAEAMLVSALHPCTLEYDLATGRRGERDDLVERDLCRLTGADAATVVNNNAAALLLVLHTLARQKDVPTSRGELIEIGGSFRLPDLMRSAGCRLREVGTTNRVHLRDYADAIGPRTGLVMKVHTSNYAVVGFTASVGQPELAALCRERQVPLAVDLGSGTLVDLRKFGLPCEPTAAQAVADGADLVTFSGDKLLGGPQAGIIVGRAGLIARIRRNPLKRALRVDKLTMAALAAVLASYADPDRLPERLPVLRLLTRPVEDIRAEAAHLAPGIAQALGPGFTVEVIDCASQIGSGALPTDTIASAGVAIRPAGARRGGARLQRLAAAFRDLPVPVIGRVHDGAFLLDVRCLEDAELFVAQLDRITTGGIE